MPDSIGTECRIPICRITTCFACLAYIAYNLEDCLVTRLTPYYFITYCLCSVAPVSGQLVYQTQCTGVRRTRNASRWLATVANKALWPPWIKSLSVGSPVVTKIERLICVSMRGLLVSTDEPHRM
jgi:hypothetical protein